MFQLNLIETLRLIEGMEAFDAVCVIIPFRKQTCFFYVYVLLEFVLVEMLVSGKGDRFNLFSLPFRHSVKNGHAIRTDLSVGVNLNIEEALTSKIPYQILAAFKNHLGRKTVLLVNRQQLVFVPRPKVRALHNGMHDGSGLNLESNIRKIRFGVVVCANQLYLSSKMVFALQAGL